jgi:hypothetical protein
MRDTKQIAILCFISDVVISVWTYFQLSNFASFKKIIGPVSESPDYQLQLYQVLLQSVTFGLLLFLFFHLIIAILFWKKKMYAIKYMHFYTLMAAISSALMIFSGYFIGLIPMIIYILSFNLIRKSLKKL